MTDLSVVFISDVHVDPDGPDRAPLDRFIAFLDSLPGRARALFILGDLFDLWTGHADADRPDNRRVIDALDRLERAGLSVTFVAGNRDLYFHDYLKKHRLLRSYPDLCLLELDGKRLLVTHGDLLCLRDRCHLLLRRILSLKPFRLLFLALPHSLAGRLARSLRRHSQRAVRSKNPDTLAVDDDALRGIFSRSVDVVVCGHTHRAEHRVLTVDGRACELFVLDAWTSRPGFLEYRNGSFTLGSPTVAGPLGT